MKIDPVLATVTLMVFCAAVFFASERAYEGEALFLAVALTFAYWAKE